MVVVVVVEEFAYKYSYFRTEGQLESEWNGENSIKVLERHLPRLALGPI